MISFFGGVVETTTRRGDLPGPTCAANQYPCVDGTCIPSAYRCDNQQDCPDGSDELNCPTGKGYLNACEDERISPFMSHEWLSRFKQHPKAAQWPRTPSPVWSLWAKPNSCWLPLEPYMVWSFRQLGGGHGFHPGTSQFYPTIMVTAIVQVKHSYVMHKILLR